MDTEIRQSHAAVFYENDQPLRFEEFPLPRELEPGAALCRVAMSTICGSDLQTISGRRQEPAPLVLGHEIVGTIVALGDGLTTDGFGDALSVGDLVSWSIAASCGNCFYCLRDLPQKCTTLHKYGHLCIHDGQPLSGGYAEHVYLFPGTSIFKVPPGVTADMAAPANCALSTVLGAADAVGITPGDAVLIQGAGLLGLNLIALAREAGAGVIAVLDANGKRLELARAFGAHLCLDANDEDAVLKRVYDATDGHGADVAFEVCGAGSAVPFGVEALRTGGRYALTIARPSEIPVDLNRITRKCLTIMGIHNYHPRHLGRALRFLAEHGAAYPYDKIVGHVYPLERINEAVACAFAGECIRVGVRPSES